MWSPVSGLSDANGPVAGSPETNSCCLLQGLPKVYTIKILIIEITATDLGSLEAVATYSRQTHFGEETGAKRQVLYTGAGTGAVQRSWDRSWRQETYTRASTRAGDWSSIQEPEQEQETGTEYRS